MGNKIVNCCYPPEHFDKLEHLLEDKAQQPIIDHRRRKSLPVAFYFQPVENNLQFQELIRSYKKNERRMKRIMSVDVPAIEQNNLSSVYYIVNQQAFYIGEWAYNQLFESDVPTGVGRLYDQHYISEGVFDVANLPYEIRDEKQRKNQDQERMEQLRSELRVVLNGKGRKFNQTQILEGNFIQDRLEGQGSYEQRTAEGNTYKYEGFWSKGRRNGRGIEETKTFRYNGEFLNDKREGKGTFEPILSATQHGQLSADDKRVKQKLKNIEMREQAQKIQIAQTREKKNEFYRKVEKFLQRYPCQMPAQSESMTNNYDYMRERSVRTYYKELYNGDFKNDKFDGIGMYIWFSGKVYRGDWEEGKLHGNGQFIWPNNVSYRGEYRDDNRHGVGELCWTQATRWRGNWAYGMRHGFGMSIKINEDDWSIKVVAAKWKKDKQVHVFFKEVRNLNGDLIQRPLTEQSDNSGQLPLISQNRQKQEDLEQEQFKTARGALKSTGTMFTTPSKIKGKSTASRTWMKPNFFQLN